MKFGLNLIFETDSVIKNRLKLEISVEKLALCRYKFISIGSFIIVLNLC